MSLKISEMTAATSVADADLIPIVQGGTNKKATAYMLTGGQGRGVLWGLRNSKTAALTVGVAAGVAWANDGSGAIALSSSITKTLNNAWAVGSGNGGRDAGSIAGQTWYYVWLIRRPDTGVVDVLLSTSATSPTMPTNYTQKCRIGAWFTEPGATFVWNVIQRGDVFVHDSPIGAFDNVIGTTGTSINLTYVPSVPIVAHYKVSCQLNSAARALLFRSPLVSQQAPNSQNYNAVPCGYPRLTSTNLGTPIAEMDTLTEDAHVWAQSNGGNQQTYIEVLGWRDLGLRVDV